MDREAIDARVDELRRDHPEREDFIGAVREFAETLAPGEREVLGRALLERPSTGGFDAITERVERGGWLKRSFKKLEDGPQSR